MRPDAAHTDAGQVSAAKFPAAFGKPNRTKPQVLPRNLRDELGRADSGGPGKNR
jgi:hypothetical protein